MNSIIELARHLNKTNQIPKELNFCDLPFFNFACLKKRQKREQKLHIHSLKTSFLCIHSAKNKIPNKREMSARQMMMAYWKAQRLSLNASWNLFCGTRYTNLEIDWFATINLFPSLTYWIMCVGPPNNFQRALKHLEKKLHLKSH